MGIREKQINPNMKDAANTCPTVDSLYKNLLHPGVFDTVVVFKRSPPFC